MRQALIQAFLVFLAVLAGGCVSRDLAKAAREANPAPCPNIIVLEDAARAVEFADSGKSIADVTYSAEIEDVSLACRYFADKPIDVSVAVDLAFGRGPAAPANEKDFTYFVAVTRTNLEVIAKREFTIPVQFSEKNQVKRVEEEIENIVIPRAKEATAGTNFEVIVGLKITPAQAVYNRSGKSLKFPDL